MLVEATSLSINVTVTGVTVPLNPPVAIPLISITLIALHHVVIPWA